MFKTLLGEYVNWCLGVRGWWLLDEFGLDGENYQGIGLCYLPRLTVELSINLKWKGGNCEMLCWKSECFPCILFDYVPQKIRVLWFLLSQCFSCGYGREYLGSLLQVRKVIEKNRVQLWDSHFYEELFLLFIHS